MVRGLTLFAACLLIGAGSTPTAPFPLLGGTMTILVTPEQTNGASVTIQTDFPPGAGPPAHIHTREDETYVVTQGHFRFWHGKQVVDAEPGSVVYMPRNEAHQFRNVGNTPATAIVTIAPAGLEKMFLTMSQRNLSVPKDVAEIVRLGTQYGITYVAPLDYKILPSSSAPSTSLRSNGTGGSP